MTLVLGRADLEGLVPTEAAVRAVEEILRDLGLGTMVQPAPTALAAREHDSMFIPMTALSDRLDLTVVKVMADIPSNRAIGEPVQRSTVLALSRTTGECVAVLDGATLTRQRTAAASAVATAHLSRADSRVLGLVGAGGLAVEHVRALSLVRPFERVVVWSRGEETVRRFADRLAALGIDLPVTSLPSPQAVTEASDVLCTLTPSKDPIVRGAWFHAGQHINAVGAPPRPDHREIDAAGIGAAELFVDSAATALAKSGEVLLAIAEGVLPGDPVLRGLGAVVAGRDPGRSGDAAITLFDSVGIGAQDLALAALAIDAARSAGRGTDVVLGPQTPPTV